MSLKKAISQTGQRIRKVQNTSPTTYLLEELKGDPV